jgi:phage shock protein E
MLNMNVADFARIIAETDVIILDVRTESEFAEGYIEGAHNLDFNSGAFEAELASLDKSATYALYCRSGKRSGHAGTIMREAGFEEVYNLEGGILDWSGAGMPSVRR